MRMITCYLLKAFLGPLLLCFISFNVIFIIFDLFGNLSRFLESDLGFLTILRYYGGVVSMYSHWFLPASCMLATLYTMWQLSHHSELTAMRASGISFHRLALPFFMASLAMCLFTFVNSEYIAPEASVWSERLKDAYFSTSGESDRKNLQYVDAQSGRNWLFLSVDPSSERSMSRPAGGVEVRQERDGINVSGIRTKHAEYLDGIWWFQDPREIKFDIDGQELPASAEPAASPGPGLGIVPMLDYTETPRTMMLEHRDWEFFSVSDMLHQMRRTKVTDSGKWYELWYRLASPWACVVITIFAIPAGISTGRQSVIKGVILALAAFFSFYGLTLVLKFFAYHHLFPSALAALLPNIVYLVVGLAMYRRLT